MISCYNFNNVYAFFKRASKILLTETWVNKVVLRLITRKTMWVSASFLFFFIFLFLFVSGSPISPLKGNNTFAKIFLMLTVAYYGFHSKSLSTQTC